MTWSPFIESKRIDQKKPLELISDYNKVAGYKVNIQKSITSLYTRNEQVEVEIKSTILSTLASPKWNTYE